jgi:sugar O-acyltransferase (sialic acid O-acetyltransferase NeuD family)
MQSVRTKNSERESRTSSPQVVVFGASGQAKVVLDILRLLGVFVAGLLDDFKPLGSECGGHHVIGALRDLPAISAEYNDPAVVVAVGDNWRRSRIVEQIHASSPGTAFVTAIHPSAQIASDVQIGPGTVIMAGAVVNAGARIGPYCIINTRASVDHDSTLEEYASLAPAATTGGGVSIGAFSSIGMGAIVMPAVAVGKHTVIGAGALVYRSIPDLVVAYGTPARVIRSRQPGDSYLRDVAATEHPQDG